jgi:hypothetical protein
MLELLLQRTWLPTARPVQSDAFFLNGSRLRDVRGRIVAVFVRHNWEVNGVHYSHIASPTPVFLEFQSIDHSFEHYGPSGAIDLRGPAIWIGNTIVAILTKEVWRRPGRNTDWDTVALCERIAH